MAKITTRATNPPKTWAAAPELTEALEQLRREHHVLASVRHPNVVRVLELFESPDLALGLELIQGRPFHDALDGDQVPSGAERTEPWRLERLVADRNTSRKVVWRSRIVLLSAGGRGTMEIMRRTGTSSR